ncbi:MAG TPA: response regulator [Pirellulales bacterium]|nr:response regulator [Pirellulales bacterium]
MDHACSLLLVDDDEEFLEILVRRFVRRGMQTTGATNPQSAMQAVQEQKFDVAILDRSLPGEDGLELMLRLKECQPELRVILLSGHGDKQAVTQARDGGAFDYLVKPCSLADLETAVRSAYQSVVGVLPQ